MTTTSLHCYPGLNTNDILPIVHLWRVSTHKTCRCQWHWRPVLPSFQTALTVRTRSLAAALAAARSSWLLPPRGAKSASGMSPKWWRLELQNEWLWHCEPSSISLCQKVNVCIDPQIKDCDCVLDRCTWSLTSIRTIQPSWGSWSCVVMSRASRHSPSLGDQLLPGLRSHLPALTCPN